MTFKIILIAAALLIYLMLGVGSSCLCALGQRLEKKAQPQPTDLQIVVAILIWPFSICMLLWTLFVMLATLPAKMILARGTNEAK